MAAIQNDRDLMLQAAPERVMPLPIDDIAAAVRGIALTASSTQFKVSPEGVATPASITFTAKRTLISETPTWSVVAGSATLTGSGPTTRTLTAGNMTSQSATIRVSVVSGGQTYYSDVTVVKVTDGVRGTVMLSTTITSGSWSDAAANALVESATGSPARVVGDLVTLVNTSNSSSQTRRWDGGAWVVQSRFIGGNVIVGGSLSGQTFTAGTFSGAIILGSQAIRVIQNGDFTLEGVGVGGPLYKAVWNGTTGVWDMGLTLNQYGPSYFAGARITALEVEDALTGATGGAVLLTGRKFWVKIGSGGAQEMEIGVRIS